MVVIVIFSLMRSSAGGLSCGASNIQDVRCNGSGVDVFPFSYPLPWEWFPRDERW